MEPHRNIVHNRKKRIEFYVKTMFLCAYVVQKNQGSINPIVNLKIIECLFQFKHYDTLCRKLYQQLIPGSFCSIEGHYLYSIGVLESIHVG